MLGLAVGIDYALFIVARHQDQVRAGIAPEESASRATGTAGSAVVFAGVTVLIALIGLSFAGIPFLTTMGIAAAGAVAVAVLVAVTPVSYTHLDVYKRQALHFADMPFAHQQGVVASVAQQRRQRNLIRPRIGGDLVASKDWPRQPCAHRQTPGQDGGPCLLYTSRCV